MLYFILVEKYFLKGKEMADLDVVTLNCFGNSSSLKKIKEIDFNDVAVCKRFNMNFDEVELVSETETLLCFRFSNMQGGGYGYSSRAFTLLFKEFSDIFFLGCNEVTTTVSASRIGIFFFGSDNGVPLTEYSHSIIDDDYDWDRNPIGIDIEYDGDEINYSATALNWWCKCYSEEFLEWFVDDIVKHINKKNWQNHDFVKNLIVVSETFNILKYITPYVPRSFIETFAHEKNIDLDYYGLDLDEIYGD